MRGLVSCERCGWSRIYTRMSVGRVPAHCPACGRRVVRERNPDEQSPAVAHWAAIAQKLSPPPRPGEMQRFQ